MQMDLTSEGNINNLRKVMGHEMVTEAELISWVGGLINPLSNVGVNVN